MVGVCSTFASATETTVEELKNCSKNENTVKTTRFWLSVWKDWSDEIENYEPAVLNTYRHLKNKGCTLSIVRDREFSSSKEVLEDKAKELRLARRGKRPNKARQVSEEEEKILEERKTRGKNPESLIQTD